jgi:MFS family permease
MNETVTSWHYNGTLSIKITLRVAPNMHKNRMTAPERRSVFGLSAIMGLRMIGLFMVLPVFTLYAETLPGATPFRIGLALGIYGLAQALLQIPFGTLSDRFGRKPMILIGLTIFVIGSFIAGFATSMPLLIVGRALQGAGAVGSTILALMADLTREEQRTKSMAIAGITIGFSFSVAMLLGPILNQWMTVGHLFYLAVFFGIGAIILLYTLVPTPTHETFHTDTEPEFHSFMSLLTHPELAKMNIGIFLLHAIFTASFVVIPISLLNQAHLASSQQWHVYLPTLLAGFVVSLICIGLAERKRQVKRYFVGGIATMALAETCLWLASTHLIVMIAGLWLFFTGFSLMEAFLPSLISRTAPKARKGSAMGIYSCAQFLGIFAGGVLGGWLYGQFSLTGVYLFSLLLSLSWFILALSMQPRKEQLQSIPSI